MAHSLWGLSILCRWQELRQLAVPRCSAARSSDGTLPAISLFENQLDKKYWQLVTQTLGYCYNWFGKTLTLVHS